MTGEPAAPDPLAAADDPYALRAALEAPLPVTVAAVPERMARDGLLEVLRDTWPEAQALPWHPDGIRLPPLARPGRHWSHRAGLCTIQEEASLMPPLLLDVRPGHRVLDLCAAPGIKTVRLGLALGNRGTLVANDVSVPRLGTIQDVAGRAGLVNLSVCQHDGTRLPDCGPWDRVLVDAPCTAEGNPTRRARPVRMRGRSPEDFRRWITGQQRALLCRALQVCAVGGRVVYSTCTFAPEENECVVADVLEAFGEHVRAVPAPLPALGTRPGLSAWNGRTFPDALRHAVRLWPHVSGTGGFFAVALQRVGGRDPDPVAAASAGERGAADPCLERHGLPEGTRDALRTFRRNKYLRAVAADHAPPGTLRYAARGLPLAHVRARVPRLTTQGALLLGRAARRNVVDLPEALREAFHARRTLTLAGFPEACDGGPTIVRCRGVPLGIGTLRASGDAITLESEFPRAWIGPAPGAADDG